MADDSAYWANDSGLGRFWRLAAAGHGRSEFEKNSIVNGAGFSKSSPPSKYETIFKCFFRAGISGLFTASAGATSGRQTARAGE